MRTKAVASAVGAVALLSTGVFGLFIGRGYFGPPVVTVRNDSGSVVHEIILEGNGFSCTLPDLAPGGSVATIVRPRGESSLKISFVLNGRPVTKDDMTYLESEGGYRTSVTIRKDGVVECLTDFGFSWRRAV